MSSLQEKKALCVLAVAHGAIISVGRNYDLGPVFANKVADLCDLLKAVGRHWPVKNDRDVPAWVEGRLKKWSALDHKVDGDWSVLGLASLALHALTDLDERAEKKARQTHHHKYYVQRGLLNACLPRLIAVIEEIDPTGKRHDIYEMTDKMLKELYRIMED